MAESMRDLHGVLRQGLAELKNELTAELKNELRSGLELLKGEWGSPLDDTSKLRQGLRAELQVQLQVAAMRIESDEPGEHYQARMGHLRSSSDGIGSQQTGATGGVRSQSSAGVRSRSAGQRGQAARAEAQLRASQHCASQQSQPSEPELGADDDPSERVGCESDEGIAATSAQFRDRSTGVPSECRTEKHHISGIRDMLEMGPWWEIPSGNGMFASLRRLCGRIVHSNFRFDLLMGVAIVLNSICIGLEIQWTLDGDQEKVVATHIGEQIFLAIFVIELIIRFFADGPIVLRSTWFLFDLVLVSIGVITEWIAGPVRAATSDDGDWGIVSQILIIRVLRLLRLIRSLRLLDQFQELWKLASGLMASIRTVCSAFLLIMIAVYILAGLGIELITRSDELRKDDECNAIIDANFRSLPLTMLTLVQFANADSIAGIYGPLIAKQWHLAIYFGMVWLIVTISLMNLVTGVIVDRAISQGHIDREMEMYAKRKMLKTLTPIIQNVFRALDKDGNGMLQLSEVRAGLRKLEKQRDMPSELQEVMKADKLTDLFSFLDADDSGEVDEEEFLDGVFHLALQTVPLETTQMLQLLRTQGDHLNVIRDLERLKAAKGSHMVMSKNHSKGYQILDVELDLPAVHISGGGHAERKYLQSHTFSMRLHEPLRHDYPKNSVVSHFHIGDHVETNRLHAVDSTASGVPT